MLPGTYFELKKSTDLILLQNLSKLRYGRCTSIRSSSRNRGMTIMGVLEWECNVCLCPIKSSRKLIFSYPLRLHNENERLRKLD